MYIIELIISFFVISFLLFNRLIKKTKKKVESYGNIYYEPNKYFNDMPISNPYKNYRKITKLKYPEHFNLKNKKKYNYNNYLIISLIFLTFGMVYLYYTNQLYI